jgi:prepilin-type N-terminal cleavage/methylation domain-containing protein
MRTARTGLTLIEVIVAMLLFSVGALGLAATSAAITRQMTLSLSRSRAASIARTRDEEIHAAGCAGISSGSDTKLGIISSWNVSHGTTASIDQTLERQGINSVATDHFLSAVPCT